MISTFSALLPNWILFRPFFEKFNVLFVFVFNDTLDDGTRLARSRVRLMKRIARLFRDPDTRHIVLSRVDRDTCEVENKTNFNHQDNQPTSPALSCPAGCLV